VTSQLLAHGRLGIRSAGDVAPREGKRVEPVPALRSLLQDSPAEPRPIPRRCPACGYDLRGLPAPVTCPECGWSCDPDTLVLHGEPPGFRLPRTSESPRRWFLGTLTLAAPLAVLLTLFAHPTLAVIGTLALAGFALAGFYGASSARRQIGRTQLVMDADGWLVRNRPGGGKATPWALAKLQRASVEWQVVDAAEVGRLTVRLMRATPKLHRWQRWIGIDPAPSAEGVATTLPEDEAAAVVRQIGVWCDAGGVPMGVTPLAWDPRVEAEATAAAEA
jgi:hypothetical protein